MASISPTEAAAEPAEATAARESFDESFALPPGYRMMPGLGDAARVYGVAVGNSTWRFGTVAFVVGLTFAMSLLALAMRRFRARNGAWISGVTGFRGPHATLPVVLLFVGWLVACIAVATWLMVAGHPIISALVALSLLPATAIGDRWWMARYRANH